jgi:hypothetical protein
MRFSTTGKSFYINGINDTIYQFDMVAPWSLSTASYASKSKFVGTNGNLNPTGIDFKYDGTIMFVQDTTLAPNTRRVTAWTMSTPWDVSTAVESTTNRFSVGTQDTNPYDFYMRYDGLGFYVVGPNLDAVFQYSIGDFQQPLTAYTSVIEKTFNLTMSDQFTAWYTPADIGSTNFNLATGATTSGSDFGPWVRTSTSAASLVASVPQTTPSEFTAIIKSRATASSFLLDDTIFYRSLDSNPALESIGYSSGFSRRDIAYASASGSGSIINVQNTLDNNPPVIITLRQRDTAGGQTVDLDIYNLDTGTLVYRNTVIWRTNLGTANRMVFPLGNSASTALQFYEGATFDSYLSNARLDSIYASAFNTTLRPPASYPSISAADEVFKFDMESGSLSALPDLSLNNWTPPGGSRGTSGISLGPSGPYGTGRHMKNNNAGNNAGISTLGSSTYASYHNANIPGSSWTMEANVYITGSTATNKSMSIWSSGVSNVGIQNITGSSTAYHLTITYSTNTTANGGSGITLSIPDFKSNTWHHVVITNISTGVGNNTVYAYVDGKLQGIKSWSVSTLSLYASSDNGAYAATAFIFANGTVFYIDNVRLLKGAPFNLSGFMPPVSAFSGTSLDAPAISGTWSTSGDLITPRQFFAGVGSKNAGFAIGGRTTGFVQLASTETYNGSTWTAAGNMSTARFQLSAVGTTTSALAISASSGSTTEIYNGTSWSSSANLATSQGAGAAFGSATAAVLTGGFAGSATNTSQIYNGTSWAVGPSLITGRYSHASANNLIFGGELSGNRLTSTEQFNGITWTSGGTQLGNAGSNIRGGGTSPGNALSVGGQPLDVGTQITQSYDNGVWVSRANLNTRRDAHAVSGGSTGAATFGGRNSSAGIGFLSSTEKYE